MRQYASTISVIGATIVTYAAFGLLFPAAKRLLAINDKQGEVALFFITAGIAIIGWITLCSMKKMRVEPMKITGTEEAAARGGVYWLVALIATYIGAMWWGAESSWVPADIFNEHKEFGLHLDALARMNHGAYPWLDFAYPYGLYPITAAWLLWQLTRDSGALLYVGAFMNICAIALFWAAMRRVASTKYARLGYIWLLAYLSSSMIFSVYQGLQANWLRYLSPLLIIATWPATGKIKPLRVVLFGLATGLIFFIAPELSPFVAASMLLALLYLNEQNLRREWIWYALGLLISCIPALALWENAGFPRIDSVLGNIFYQSTFILKHNQLTQEMPDLISRIYALLRSDSSAMHALMAIWTGLLFYLPMTVVVWSIGWIWSHRPMKTRRWYIACILTVAIFIIFLKSLGASSLGYALLTTPIIIVLVGLFLDTKPTPRSLIGLFSVLVFSSAVYGAQQQLLPCLSSENGHACRYIQRKKGISKKEITAPGANAIQKFYEDDVEDFEKLVAFLRSVPGKIMIMSDLTSLYYYAGQKPPGKIMLPSLYLPGADQSEIEALAKEATVIILPKKGYNFIDRVEIIFPKILTEVKRYFTYAGSCGEQDIYVRNDGQIPQLCEGNPDSEIIPSLILPPKENNATLMRKS